MSELLPHLIGFGFVACLLIFALVFPRSPWTATLFERYGVRVEASSRPLTRTDYFRSAAGALAISCILGTVAAALFPIAERIPNGTRGNLFVSEFAFIFTLLAGLAFACSVAAVWNGMRWRPATESKSVDDQAI